MILKNGFELGLLNLPFIVIAAFQMGIFYFESAPSRSVGFLVCPYPSGRFSICLELLIACMSF